MFEPGTFNPYSLVKYSMSLIFEKAPSNARPSVRLAERYLAGWESMYKTKESRYPAMSRPVNSVEREAVTDAVSYLGELLHSLADYKSDHEVFERQMQSEIARLAAPVGFADGDLYEHAANAIVISSTSTLFTLRDEGAIEGTGIVASAIMFSFARYEEWLHQAQE